ncbi:Ras family member Ga [Balamuthia mandrillaris]
MRRWFGGAKEEQAARNSLAGEVPLPQWGKTLPDELLLHIFSYLLDAKALIAIRQVCRHWAGLGLEDRLWERPAKLYLPPFLMKEVLAHRRCGGYFAVVKEEILEAQRVAGLGPIDLKAMTIGDHATGKTCLLIRCLAGVFAETYVPTCTDDFDVDFPGGIRLTVWDSNGYLYRDGFRRLRSLSYAKTNVLLLTFSFANPQSLANVSGKWIPEVSERCPGVPIVLVGTKYDSHPGGCFDPQQDPKQLVTLEQAKAVADSIDAAALVYCSAREGLYVGDVFRAAMRAALQPTIHSNAKADSKHRCLLQ